MQQLGPSLTLTEAQQRLDSSTEQEQGARLSLLSLDQQLKDAYHTHTQTRHTHALFKE